MTAKRSPNARRRSAPLPVGKLRAAPPPPEHLNSDAKEVWGPASKYMLDRGTLHSADVHVLEVFCNAVARVRQLQRWIDATGYADEDGRVNPAARMIEAAVATVRSTAMLLGLAPYTRERMRAEVRNKESGFDEEGEWARLLKR